MTRKSTGGTASRRESHQPPTSERRATAGVALLISAALAVSTAVAATAVSIGIARADVAGVAANGDGASLAVALGIGLLISALGGLTAVAVRRPQRG